MDSKYLLYGILLLYVTGIYITYVNKKKENKDTQCTLYNALPGGCIILIIILITEYNYYTNAVVNVYNLNDRL